MTRHMLGTAATLALLSGTAFAQTTETATSDGEMMTIQQCAPVVTVTQTPPTVMVTMPEDAGQEPQVTVTQAPPDVTVEMCAPTLMGADGSEMQAQLVEAEAEINIEAAETAELQVSRMTDPASEVEAAQEAPAAEPQDERQAAVPSVEPLPDRAETPDGQPATEPGPIEAGPAAEAPSDDEAQPSGTALPAEDTQDTEQTPEASDQEEVEPAGNAEMATDQVAPAGDTAAPAEMPAEDAASDVTTPDMAPETAAPIEEAAARNDIALREGNTVVEAGDAMTEGMEGVAVFSADDEEIGQISRFDTEAEAAIVSVGGFLGLGERDVALPLSDLSFQRGGDGEIRAYVAIPSEQVDDLPAHEGAE